MKRSQTNNKLIALEMKLPTKNHANFKRRNTDARMAPILLLINILALLTLLENTVAITAPEIPATTQFRDTRIHEIVRDNYETTKRRQTSMPKYDQHFYQRPIATDDHLTTSYANYLRSPVESPVPQTSSDLKNNLWAHGSITNANEFLANTRNAAGQHYSHSYAPTAKTQKERTDMDDVLVYPKGKFDKFNYAERIRIPTDDDDKGDTDDYMKNYEGYDDISSDQQLQKQQVNIFPRKIDIPVRLNYFTSGDAFARTYTLEDYGSGNDYQSAVMLTKPPQQRKLNQDLSKQLPQHNFNIEHTKMKKPAEIDEEKQEASSSQLQIRIADSNQNEEESSPQLYYQHAQEITHADEHDTIDSTQHILQHLQHQLHQQQQQFAELQHQLLLYTQQHSTSQPIQANVHSTNTLPPITTRVRHTSESAAALAGIPLRKHVHITKNVPVPHYQQVHVPYNQTVPIEIPRPVITAVPRPVAIHVPMHKTIAVPQINDVKIPIEKVKPYPVEHPMPFIVERRVPYRVEKQVATPVYYPYPIKVPIIKTIVHKLPHNRDINSRSLSTAQSSSLSGSVPQFLSRGQTYRVVVGDTLVLPCKVENLGNYVLLWRRGSNVLTASSIIVTRDERVKLKDGYNLEISDLEPQDAGDYVCQISDKINRDQVHTVEILVPPSVRANPTSGQMQARKGGPITLECKGSGNPVPSIFWTKKSGAGNSSIRIGNGPILILEKLERQQAGVYQCTADNGVGDSVTVDMRLDVLYPPDIQVEKSWIHSGEGFEANLVCIVYADPVATVSWYQNSFPIQMTDRRIMSSRHNKHILTIRHIQQEDFGNYSCVAENSLGRSRKYMELSGHPGPAEFYSSKWGRSSDSYNLTWKIDSYPPLEEVRLLYRRVLMNDTFQQPGKWHDFILIPEIHQAAEPLTHFMSHIIKNLSPGAYYEAVVQAKNRYGWNEVSDTFQFNVASNKMDISPEDVEVVASSKSFNNTNNNRGLCTHHYVIVAISTFLTYIVTNNGQLRNQIFSK